MKELIYTIFADSRTVFRLNDIALLLNSVDIFLSQKLNKLVNEGLLLNLRKGIYAKKNYKHEELACILYTPTYISLNYVLARNSVVFQFDSAITSISYLTREITVDNQRIEYRKIKKEILLNTTGIICKDNINIATPERAFLDALYLFGDVYFDNLHALNYKMIKELLPVYKSKRIENYIKRNFEENG
ncbi:MAG: hypothetical protein LBH32_01135 [Dysgonamonadaceae bacterium]|jgi:hypothetical protein|nr:hypothetical protein [Dysgonamonadaceae bacterium]